jgi:hypothetical protein
MPLSLSSYFRNVPCKTRFARRSSFRISATDFRPRIQSHSLLFPPEAITFYPSANLDTQFWGDPAHWDPIPGLKQNT